MGAGGECWALGVFGVVGLKRKNPPCCHHIGGNGFFPPLSGMLKHCNRDQLYCTAPYLSKTQPRPAPGSLPLLAPHHGLVRIQGWNSNGRSWRCDEFLWTQTLQCSQIPQGWSQPTVIFQRSIDKQPLENPHADTGNVKNVPKWLQSR